MSHDRAPRGGQFLGQGEDAIAEAIDRKRPGPAAVEVERNWCDATGALELSRRIMMRFWEERGARVEMSFERCNFTQFPLTAIRSNLRNGLPRR